MIRRIWLAMFFATLICPASIFGQTAYEYTDKDKKKMAEIGQRPEVQARIDDAWQKIRRQDMQFAFNVNSSTRIMELSPSSIAEFREKYGQLYDNPILLRYVNSLGQKLVPDNSPNLYAFRLLLDPVPKAEALSTGTIYISTGLVSLLDNEAQLSYVLAHEIAHVERRHHYNQIRNEILEDEFEKFKEADLQRKKGLFSALSMAAGAGLGAGIGGAQGAMIGALSGMAASSMISHFAFRNKFEPTEWNTMYENEADEAGLKYMLERSYDAREIPRLYARMDNLVSRDQRVGLGFVGNPKRVKERTAKIQAMLMTDVKADIETRMKGGGLTGSTPEFSLLMSALKRDNGVVALDYDLFAMAKDNLEDAVKLRSNDPRVNYYLGQVVALTGRKQDEKQQALNYFETAIRHDADRGAYAEPHLEMALHLISQADPKYSPRAVDELKSYVALYQREHAGTLPPNMHIIYDYFLLAGDTSWYVPPAIVVSTKNVDSLTVTTSATSVASSKASEVIMQATSGKVVNTSIKK